MNNSDLFYGTVGELAGKTFPCECGKVHKVNIEDIVIESNALEKLEEIIQQFNNNHIMLVADQNTYNIAGKKLATLTNKMGFQKNT
jgi:glycerol-1-phosphate dehydrogenase [NAD(P)+]